MYREMSVDIHSGDSIIYHVSLGQRCIERYQLICMQEILYLISFMKSAFELIAWGSK